MLYIQCFPYFYKENMANARKRTGLGLLLGVTIFVIYLELMYTCKGAVPHHRTFHIQHQNVHGIKVLGSLTAMDL